MKSSLSPQTSRWLDQLHNSADGWELTFRKGRIKGMIRALGDTGEALLASALLEFAFNFHRGISRTAANSIAQLLQACSAEELAYLCKRMREAGEYGSTPWMQQQLVESAVAKTWGLGAPGVFVLGLSSFCQSGYVREIAVQELGRCDMPEAIPFLMLRLNDWVPQVQRAAMAAIENFLTVEHAGPLVEALPALIRFLELPTSAFEEWMKKLREQLASPAFAEALKAGLSSDAVRVRRECTSIAIQAKRADTCRAGLASPDPHVRRHCADYLLGSLQNQPKIRLIEQLLDDVDPSVRRSALRAAATQQTNNLHALLERGLMDPSSKVRSTAAFHMRESFGMDLAGFYRSQIALASGRSLGIALMGLERFGDAGDVELLLPHRSSPCAHIARPALRALGRLDPGNQARRMTELLAHAKRSFSKIARDFFLEHHVLMDLDAMESMLRSNPLEHVRFHAFEVLKQTGKWSRLRFGLIALGHADGELQKRAATAIRDWMRDFNRLQQPPTPIEVEAVQAQATAARKALDLWGLTKLNNYLAP